MRRPPRSTLFPSTTLSRSRGPRGAPCIVADEPAHEPMCPAGERSPGRRHRRGIELGRERIDELSQRARAAAFARVPARSEEHTSELQSLAYLVCRLLLAKN